jgi:hypothetical protein
MSSRTRGGAAARPAVEQPSVLLTSRDIEALKWISEQFAVRVDHLPRLLGGDIELSRRATRAVLERWSRAEFVVRRKVFAHEPAWVWLTRHGSNAGGGTFKVWVPKFGNLTHVYWVNEIRLQTAIKHPDAFWICERTIRKESRRGTHIPDAELISANGAKVAVEVELTQKSAGRAASITRELADRYGTIWYFVFPSAKRTISRAIEELGDEKGKFRIYDLESVR